MRNFVRFLIISVIFLTGIDANAASLPMPQSFADEVEMLSPAVVNVSTTQKVKVNRGNSPQLSFPPGSPIEQFNEMMKRGDGGSGSFERDVTSLGSGFIIDPKGIIITNNHVVSEAEEITVILHDDTKLKAEIIGRDAKIDVAVLRVKSDKPLPYVSFGDSDKVRVGDWVIAIGNPYGLGGTVTTGIISARARDINVGTFDDFLQTDAAINRGNSGGPMFDLAGKVIGINTAIFSPTGGSVGIGFAIPAALAEPIIKQILQFGQAKRAWLGVQIQPVTEKVAEALGMAKATGALVLSAVPEGPAAAAGVVAGDVILKFDGKDITDMKKLPRYVADSPIGERKTMQVLRGGQVRNLTVDLKELKEDEQAAATHNKQIVEEKAELQNAILGMQLTKTDKEGGLVVVAISPNSDAYRKGIRDGNFLLKVNQQDLNEVADLQAGIAAAKEAERDTILVLVRNITGSRFIALGLD
jgi:serine protease Do